MEFVETQLFATRDGNGWQKVYKFVKNIDILKYFRNVKF